MREFDRELQNQRSTSDEGNHVINHELHGYDEKRRALDRMVCGIDIAGDQRWLYSWDIEAEVEEVEVEKAPGVAGSLLLLAVTRVCLLGFL